MKLITFNVDTLTNNKIVNMLNYKYGRISMDI